RVRLARHTGDHRVALFDLHLFGTKLVGSTLLGVVERLGEVAAPVAEVSDDLADAPLPNERGCVALPRVQSGHHLEKLGPSRLRLSRKVRGRGAHARSSPAYSAISRLTPWPTKATVTSSSPFTNWLETTIPSPKRRWRTRSPARQASVPASWTDGAAPAWSPAPNAPLPRSTSAPS